MILSFKTSMVPVPLLFKQNPIKLLIFFSNFLCSNFKDTVVPSFKKSSLHDGFHSQPAVIPCATLRASHLSQWSCRDATTVHPGLSLSDLGQILPLMMHCLSEIEMKRNTIFLSTSTTYE